LKNFTLRNVIIIVDFVRLQFPSREALAIEPKSLPVSGGGDVTNTHARTHARTHAQRERDREREGGGGRGRAYTEWIM